jgi:hypothetical protein
MTTLEIVRIKLENSNLSEDILQLYNDKVIQLHIDEVGQSIKTYCNRTDIPQELMYVHANMVIEQIEGKERKAADDDNRVVTSIKEGDVQVSYGGKSKTLSEASTDDLIHNYKDQLNKFRKMRW